MQDNKIFELVQILNIELYNLQHFSKGLFFGMSQKESKSFF